MTPRSDYDTEVRWDAAFEYAMTKQPRVDEAMAFADNVGGDGGEKTIAARWREWIA